MHPALELDRLATFLSPSHTISGGAGQTVPKTRVLAVEGDRVANGSDEGGCACGRRGDDGDAIGDWPDTCQRTGVVSVVTVLGQTLTR